MKSNSVFNNNQFEDMLNQSNGGDGIYKPDAFKLEGDWKAPIPFPKYQLKEFPINCFPDWIREYILKLSECTQTAIDLAGTVALGVLASLCSKKWVVKIHDGWKEPLNLYVVVVAESGERKSPVFKALTGPINDFERSLEGTRLVVDDITPEKLPVIMEKNNGRIAVLSSEGGIFDILTGLYSKKVNEDVFLKAYDGEVIRVDRIERESIKVENPALTIAVTTQPIILNEIMSKYRLRNKGLLTRFLFSIPPSKVGSRKIINEPVPNNIKLRYEQVLSQLFEATIPKQPDEILLTQEAIEFSNDFAKQLENRLNGDLLDIKLWALKLHGNVIRIAGLLHIAECIGCENKEIRYINANTLNKAIEIGDYFIYHARPAFDQLFSDSRITAAKFVINWLKEIGVSTISQRDINRGTRGRIKTIKELIPVLELLEEHEYIRTIPFLSTKPGRPKIEYEVNPYIMI